MFTFAAEIWVFPKTYGIGTPVLYFAIAFPFVLGAFSLLRNSKRIAKKDNSKKSENDQEGPERSATFKKSRDFQSHSLDNGPSDDLHDNDRDVEPFSFRSLLIESSSPVFKKASSTSSIPKVDQTILTLMEQNSTLGESIHRDSRLSGLAETLKTPMNQANIENNAKNHSEFLPVVAGNNIGDWVIDNSMTLGIYQTTKAGLSQPCIMIFSALNGSSTSSIETQNETEENEKYGDVQFEQTVTSPIEIVSPSSNALEGVGPQLNPQLKMGNDHEAKSINGSTLKPSNDSGCTDYQLNPQLAMDTRLSNSKARVIFASQLGRSGTLIYLVILISIIHDTREKALDYLTKKVDNLGPPGYCQQFNLYLQNEDLLAVKQFFQNNVNDNTQPNESEGFEYATLPTLFPSLSLIAFVLHMHDGPGDTSIADSSTILSNKTNLNGHMYIKRLLHQPFFGYLSINQRLQSDMVINHKTIQEINNSKPRIKETSLSKLLELKKDRMYFGPTKPTGYKYAEIQNYCLRVIKRFSVPNGMMECQKTTLNKFLDLKVEMLAESQRLEYIKKIQDGFF